LRGNDYGRNNYVRADERISAHPAVWGF
jgi:hypothetical protein